MYSKLGSITSLINNVVLRAMFFTIAFLLLEFFTISMVYHNEIKDLKYRVSEITYKEGKNLQYICNYINCQYVVDNNNYYSNSAEGLLKTNKSNIDTQIYFGFFNKYLDTVIKYDGVYYIVNNDIKWKFIYRLMLLSSITLFIVIFILSLKIKYDELKRERRNHYNIKSDLESKLQRDLTESLHHEMGTPLAVIKTLLDEIIRLLYPCGFTKNNMCNYRINGEKIKECNKCTFMYSRRSQDKPIVEYYEQMKLSIDSLLTLQNLIGKSKKISYSNGTVSMFEIINNVVMSSNQLRIKIITANYKQKGILDTHSCRGIQNGEMLIIFNNMVLNSIEANATNITIDASVANDFLELTLTDNGRGIRDHNNHIIKDYNIFNYGYSTKDSNGENIVASNFFTNLLYKLKVLTRDNEFRGAGLSLCKDMLKKNGGDIYLLETSKYGTSFKLKIPTKITHNINKEAKYLS